MNIKMIFQKTVLLSLVAALVMAALPLTGVSAAGLSDPARPPLGGSGVSNERLEGIWQRMQTRYERLDRMFDGDTKLADRAEEMIVRLKEAGEPTADLESTLAAFEEAVKNARPIYESCKGILNSHKGFDDNGKVTDAALAKETVKELGAKFSEIRDAMGGTGKALTGLMKSIRDARAPVATPAAGA